MAEFRQNLNRRQFLGAAGVVGLTGLLAACAGPGTVRPRPTGLNLGDSRTGDISFAHWRGEDREIFEQIIAEFVQTHTGVHVEQDIATSADYEAQALRRMRNGAIGDVAPAFRGVQFTAFVASGLFAPLDSTGLTDRYEESLIDVGVSDGKHYGYPYQIVFNEPIANMDVLDEVGYSASPEDWDSYIDMLDKIKSKGMIPLAFPGADAGNAGQLFNPMVMNLAPSDDMCAKIEAGEYKCTDDWFVEMLRRYQQLGDYVQPNASGTAVEPAQQMFATGDAAILCTGSYHIASVRSLGATFPIDMAPPITSAPNEAKYRGVYNATFILGINSASDIQGAALEWLDYLSTPEVASVYANGTGQMSPVKGIEYTNPDLRVLAPWLEKDLALAPRFQFTDLDMRNVVEASCVRALTGTNPEKAAEDAQLIVDQRIAS